MSPIRFFHSAAVIILLAAVVSAPRGLQAQPATSRTLTLMTYNIHAGIPMGRSSAQSPAAEKDLHALADVIRAARPDIAALQEVDCELALTLAPQRRRSSALNEPRLLAAFTGLSYIFGSTLDDTDFASDNTTYLEWGTADRWTNNGAPHGEFGNALLLNRPVRLPPDNIPLPRNGKKERRACLRVELARPDGSSVVPPIVVYATHLQHDSGAERADQLRAILDRVAREPNDAVVFLLGDLNHAARDQPGEKLPASDADLQAILRSRGFHDLADEYARARQEIPAPTYPADTPTRRIDYILCNRALDVVDARVIDSTASDHRPVVVTVRFP